MNYGMYMRCKGGTGPLICDSVPKSEIALINPRFITRRPFGGLGITVDVIEAVDSYIFVYPPPSADRLKRAMSRAESIILQYWDNIAYLIVVSYLLASTLVLIGNTYRQRRQDNIHPIISKKEICVMAAIVLLLVLLHFNTRLEKDSRCFWRATMTCGVTYHGYYYSYQTGGCEYYVGSICPSPSFRKKEECERVCL
ncbi:MAG: hypothetical protein ABH950_01640 [Candidatus Altiarchaeota archaeon]